MAWEWSLIHSTGRRPCATNGCGRQAKWHGDAGGIGSDFCSVCQSAILSSEIIRAARGVIAFDWTDSDAGRAAAIDRLRKAVKWAS